MKLVSFFVLSTALHAAAFVYPISFPGSESERLTPVIIVGLERESGAPGKQAMASAESRAATPKTVATARSPELRLSEPVTFRAPEQPTPTANDSTNAGEGITVVLSSDSLPHEPAVPTRGGVAGLGNGTAGTGQSETGSDTPSGRGMGNGSGFARGDGNATFVQVGYAYSPKPQYPDRARRDGKEGRVLLRVLVDEEGRSKSVQVNRSSGDETLDQAAAEVIKRWRFFPARYGERSVETWVRIPIDFRLTDAREQ